MRNCVCTCRSMDRQPLDRRRLESAHFLYAVLSIVQEHPEDFSLTDINIHHGDIDQILDDVTPKYHNIFSKIYSGILCLYMNIWM